MTEEKDDSIPPPDDSGLLPRHLCRVMGLNQNHSSRSGTSYHIQIEDRGPVFDDAAEAWVRRVNLIAYANYGEPTARIVYGKDHDFPDIRTHEHNRAVARRIQELAGEARQVLEEKETRRVARIKDLLERYYRTRDDKRQARDRGGERALSVRLRARVPGAEGGPAGGRGGAGRRRRSRARSRRRSGAGVEETEYPLDPVLRELVLEIERVAGELQRDLAALKARGAADDILQATCAKLLARAKDSLTRQDTSTDFATRYLEMTRNSLVTAYRQVRARLTRLGGA